MPTHCRRERFHRFSPGKLCLLTKSKQTNKTKQTNKKQSSGEGWIRTQSCYNTECKMSSYNMCKEKNATHTQGEIKHFNKKFICESTDVICSRERRASNYNKFVQTTTGNYVQRIKEKYVNKSTNKEPQKIVIKYKLKSVVEKDQ